MKFRSRRSGWSGLVAILVTFTGFALAGAPAQGASAFKYVAMGDSYSAASGVLPPDPTAPPQCLRSSRNYPNVLAYPDPLVGVGQITLALKDVTCGAADTTHFFKEQYPGVAPQLDALDKATKLVTMTIGGNDSGVFINAILSCGSAGLSTLGTGSPCKDQYGSSFEDTVRNKTYPSLVKALKAVHNRAPNAWVMILSYPWITPKTGGCFPTMPVATGDVPYLRSLQTTLNDAVRRAAKATKTTFVSLNEVSEGHDACQPIGTRWVEPVLAGTNPVIVHPNALGEAMMAKQIAETIDGAPGNPLQPVAPQTTVRRSFIKHNKRSATFRFRSDRPNSTFRCRLDGRRFRSCRSPKSYSGLKPGKHRFRVVATDSDGRTDPSPAVKKFKIVS